MFGQCVDSVWAVFRTVCVRYVPRMIEAAFVRMHAAHGDTQLRGTSISMQQYMQTVCGQYVDYSCTVRGGQYVCMWWAVCGRCVDDGNYVDSV